MRQACNRWRAPWPFPLALPSRGINGVELVSLLTDSTLGDVVSYREVTEQGNNLTVVTHLLTPASLDSAAAEPPVPTSRANRRVAALHCSPIS